MFGWRVLAHSTDQLHGVETGLITLVVEKGNDLVQLVQVINLNLSLFLLGEGSKSSGGGSPNVGDRVCEHPTQRWN